MLVWCPSLNIGSVIHANAVIHSYNFSCCHVTIILICGYGGTEEIFAIGVQGFLGYLVGGTKIPRIFGGGY